MRATSILALTAFTVSVSANRFFTCWTGGISAGILEISNGNATTPLALAADGSLIASPDGSQNTFEFVPCTSKFPGPDHPGVVVTDQMVTAYGRLLGDGGCLSRDTASGKLMTKFCVEPDDERQAQQFWTVTLNYHGDDDATGDSTLGFVAPGFFPQLENGQVFQASSKPASTYDLRFSYSE
ncbi:hypothetical protein EXIGLDRAFT_768449 [Exidia glandulosa HHB12029]|uniref:Ricin B lectin domain-containing protein n=1 Tax=Exidia glandulosa HHB12029 TaxID=1314781 RepID=A0A165I7J8_EXIGL|nr:hypothetical protein EXIGLDRAFT_768449 [Exidia glandulosa HHB12029]